MKKQVGLIIDSLEVSKEVSDIIELSKKSKNYEISTLIINQFEEKDSSSYKKIIFFIKKRGLKKLLSALIFKLVCKFEAFFVKRMSKFQNSFHKTLLNHKDFTIVKVNPTISKSGYIYRYESKDINNIKQLNLDLLIRAGTGILRGEILSMCPNGVISFHHGDNNVNRGGPPGFWEVYERNPRTGFIIQRLKDELDGGDVLYKGFIATTWFYTLNLYNLYAIANPMFHKVLEDITSKNPKLKVHKKNPYCARLYTKPYFFQTINYLLRTFFLLIYKIHKKLCGKALRWGVAYQHTKNWNDITLRHSHKIENPKNSFLADPFIIKNGEYHYCFVEDYDYTIKKGKISAYKISKTGYKSIGVVLEEDFHLSYPFIFRYKNEIYMCPETHKKNEIRLYKCIEFPSKWQFYKTIMGNVSAADTSIFEYDGKWWLFTNIDNSIVQDHSCQLHIFTSNNPLSDSWEEHENNPVIFDSSIARNGGMIFKDNNIYRVFQRQGFDMYGESCGVAKIINLSQTEYSEEICFNIEPKFFDNIKGTHTYNFESDLAVLDYVEVSKINSGSKL